MAALTRIALGGSGANWTRPFDDKNETVEANVAWAAIPFHRATAPMSHPVVPRRMKFSIVSLREAWAMLSAALAT
jgi:hypothetical protein